MTLETWLNSLLVSDTNSLGIFDILLAVTLPFFLSFPVAWVYQRTQRSNTFSMAFIHTLFLFSCLASIMTLIIGSNIARAFGLIGALSIIRFRNALKSPIDAVYVFWSLAIGMACGTGYYFASAVVVGMVSVFALALDFFQFGAPRFQESMVRVTVDTEKEADSLQEAERLFAQRKYKFKQVNVLYDSDKSTRTYVYLLRSKNEFPNSLYTTLREINGISHVNHANNVGSVFAS